MGRSWRVTAQPGKSRCASPPAAATLITCVSSWKAKEGAKLTGSSGSATPAGDHMVVRVESGDGQVATSIPWWIPWYECPTPSP